MPTLCDFSALPNGVPYGENSRLRLQLDLQQTSRDYGFVPGERQTMSYDPSLRRFTSPVGQVRSCFYDSTGQARPLAPETPPHEPHVVE
jgi:hypothetical protein